MAGACRRWAARAACGATLLLVVLAARDVTLVARDVRAAEQALEAGSLATLSATTDLRARAALAAERLGAAHSRAQGSPWLTAFLPVPIAGDQVRAMRHLTATAARVADVVHRRTARADAALDRTETSGATGGSRAVAALAAVRREARGLRHDLAAIAVPDVPRALPPLRDAANGLRVRVTGARAEIAAGERAVAALGRLIRGPSTYLVLAANNAEMRAGSGMPLSVGTLRFENGSFHATRFVPAADLILDDPVAVPAGVEQLYGWLGPGEDWRNVASSPNFPAMAPVYASMARASGLGDVDGVLLLDVVALRHLLGVVGSVSVDGLHLDAASIERLVLSDLYGRFGSDVAGRRQLLGQVAAEVVAALDERPWETDALASAIAEAARGRHLMVWAADEEQRQAWRTVRADGALVETGVMLAVQNHGGNKLDVYLDVKAAIRQRRTDDRREVDVRLTLANRAPARLPPYVAGPGSHGLPAGDYRALVTFYLPGEAYRARPTGARVVAAGEDGPMRVIALLLDVGRGEQGEVSVRFSLPADHPPLTLLPSGRAEPATVTWKGDELTDDRRQTLLW